MQKCLFFQKKGVTMNKFINLTMDNHFIKNEINENSYKAYSLPKVSLGQKLNIEIENNNISKFFNKIQTSKGKLELPYKSARNKKSSVLLIILNIPFCKRSSSFR